MLGRVIWGLVAIVLLSPLAGVWWLAWDNERFARRAPLAANLPGRVKHEAALFNARVLGRFPPGSDERELVQQLTMQGFSTNNNSRDSVRPDRGQTDFGTAAKVLTLTRQMFACRQVWNVIWLSDDTGHITKLHAEYHPICS
jgi:hypothetical protein